MAKDRLQKIMANAEICSRRKAEELIKQNRVTINGRFAKIGEKADPKEDNILFDGRKVFPSYKYRVILINKPI